MIIRTKNVVAIVILLFVLSFGMRHIVSANWYHHKVKPGMTVSEVFSAVDGWNLCIGNSQRPTSDPALLFRVASGNSGTYGIHISNHEGNESMESREKLIETVQHQMSDGHPWHLAFTWYGIPRMSFSVSFDAQGRVDKVGGLGASD